MLKAERNKWQQVTRVCSPPPAIQGRGGATRLRMSRIDAIVVAACFPPHVRGAAGRGLYKKTVDLLLKWLADVICEARTSCMQARFFLGCDLNDQCWSNDYASRLFGEPLDRWELWAAGSLRRWRCGLALRGSERCMLGMRRRCADDCWKFSPLCVLRNGLRWICKPSCARLRKAAPDYLSWCVRRSSFAAARPRTLLGAISSRGNARKAPLSCKK